MIKQDYEKAKQNAIRILSVFEDNAARKAEKWKLFHDLIRSLNESGWKREDIYNLIWDLIQNNSNSLDETIIDELAEFETSISGNCAPSDIVRFKDEPEDFNEFVAYVRSNQWKNESD